MDSATRYGSWVPVTTIGIAQFSDQRPVGDKSADSSANAAGNVTGVPLNALVGWHSPDDWFPSIQDAPLALCWQDRQRMTSALTAREHIGCGYDGGNGCKHSSPCRNEPTHRDGQAVNAWPNRVRITMYNVTRHGA